MNFPDRVYTKEEVEQARELIKNGYKHNLEIKGVPEFVTNVKKAIKLIKTAKKYNCFLIISPTQQINQNCVPKNINAMIKTTKIFK